MEQQIHINNGLFCAWTQNSLSYNEGEMTTESGSVLIHREEKMDCTHTEYFSVAPFTQKSCNIAIKNTTHYASLVVYQSGCKQY